MNACQTTSIIYWYEELEERLIEFLKFVPFTKKNLDVYSPRLAGVITETCHILDSLFREVSKPEETIQGKIKKKKNLNVEHYAELYAKRLNLHATKSLIFVSPLQYVIPFEKWEPPTTGGKYADLPWWKAYNKLKHSRIENIQKATLAHAVHSLCGLHQVIAKLPELVRAIYRHNWLQAPGYNPEPLIEMLEGHSYSETFLVESKLFAVPIGLYPFSDNPDDLRSGDYRHSERFARYIGRW
jgi:hypothetical protein